jgi:hypothetical protein
MGTHLFQKMANNKRKALVMFFLFGLFVISAQGLSLYMADHREDASNDVKLVTQGMNGTVIGLCALMMLWASFNFVCTIGSARFSPGCRLVYGRDE